jgi:hypothetical protein
MGWMVEEGAGDRLQSLLFLSLASNLHPNPNPRHLTILPHTQGGLSFALQRQISGPAAAPLTLTMPDLRRALREARPHFGSGGDAGAGSSQSLWMRPGPGLVVREFRPEVAALLEQVMACLRKARAMGGGTGAGAAAGGGGNGDGAVAALPPLLTLLLQGPPGAGKVND